ncbi:hypothetical protein [Aridibaculum aurantiacum]|uniref:hypothetical protein n=1 Tax=Aridibaculum aurantiacum TaxID=2810307 RepID=UPI001A958D2F|nr:hypothetical protein [Aridibaculum aurantiacum]
MKKLIIPFAVLLTLVTLMSSCKKVVTAVFPGVDVQVPQVVITVPPLIMVPPNEVSLGTYSTSFNLDSIVRANTAGVFNANDISSVRVKTITVAVQNSDNLNNLSNFEYARLTISSSSNSSEANIATINFPDVASSTQTATTDNSPDLRAYLNGNQLSYNVYGKLRKPTTKSLNVAVNITMRIE